MSDRKDKPRLVLYLTPTELRGCRDRAKKLGLRSPQQWAISILVMALSAK